MTSDGMHQICQLTFAKSAKRQKCVIDSCALLPTLVSCTTSTFITSESIRDAQSAREQQSKHVSAEHTQRKLTVALPYPPPTSPSPPRRISKLFQMVKRPCTRARDSRRRTACKILSITSRCTEEMGRLEAERNIAAPGGGGRGAAKRRGPGDNTAFFALSAKKSDSGVSRAARFLHGHGRRLPLPHRDLQCLRPARGHHGGGPPYSSLLPLPSPLLDPRILCS